MPRPTTTTALTPTRLARIALSRRTALAATALLGVAAAVACERDRSRGATDATAGYTTAAPSVANDAAQSIAFEARRAPVAPSRAAAPAAEAETGGIAGGGTGTSAAKVTRSDVGAVANRVAPDMIIRTGTASVQVDSLDVAVQRVRQLAQRVGGVIANSSLQGGRDQVRTATLEVKVAAARFDDLVTGLAPFGKVESVNVTAEEVGEEYVDVNARVANARRLEARLVDLLATRTGKLSDVLTVERELARVREEIERYEGRLRYLESHSAVSTLAVTMHEPFPLLAGQPATNPIAEAFRQAWRNFVALTAVVIASLGVLVPLAGVAALGWVGYRRVRRRGAGVAAQAHG